MASWLAKRRELGVGSSEVSALFTKPGERLKGASYYESPYSLSVKKRGLALLEPEEEVEPAHLDWCKMEAEQAIGAWFARVVLPTEIPGAKLEDPGPYTIAKHPTLPLFTTLDFHAGGYPVQAKNPFFFNLREWGSEPPIGYQIQCQTEQMVLRALGFMPKEKPRGYVVASVGGGGSPLGEDQGRPRDAGDHRPQGNGLLAGSGGRRGPAGGRPPDDEQGVSGPLADRR